MSGSDEKRIAAAEALAAYHRATERQKRAEFLAFPANGAPPVNVTEEVVSLLDMIVTSIDWGSDFWSDDDLPAFITLCELLKFEEVPRA